jgi:signal transduction histidine kinase
MSGRTPARRVRRRTALLNGGLRRAETALNPGRNPAPRLVAERTDANERPGPPAPRLLAELSHDLRSPLASLRLLVEGMSDGVLEEEERAEYLARMHTQISVLADMVDDLHALSRTQAGDRVAARQAVDPHELVDRALATMRTHAEAAGITLARDSAAGLPVICANPLQLHRVLVNLIENAIRHTAAGGRVLVRARPSRGGLEIEVEDDGEGIPAEDRERVFGAFYGRDRNSSNARSGLGLAIARGTLEAHGGSISVADSPRGARLRLWLPGAPARRHRRRADDSLHICNELISATPDVLK